MALRKGQKSNEMADRVQNIADHLAHFVGGLLAAPLLGALAMMATGGRLMPQNARHGAWRKGLKAAARKAVRTKGRAGRARAARKAARTRARRGWMSG